MASFMEITGLIWLVLIWIEFGTQPINFYLLKFMKLKNTSLNTIKNVQLWCFAIYMGTLLEKVHLFMVVKGKSWNLLMWMRSAVFSHSCYRAKTKIFSTNHAISKWIKARKEQLGFNYGNSLEFQIYLH